MWISAARRAAADFDDRLAGPQSLKIPHETARPRKDSISASDQKCR
jgi:hypothetical protein